MRTTFNTRNLWICIVALALLVCVALPLMAKPTDTGLGDRVQRPAYMAALALDGPAEWTYGGSTVFKVTPSATGVTVGSASTQVATVAGRWLVRTLATDPLDATPANRPAGTKGEIAQYGSTPALYICTNASTPVWASTVVTEATITCTGAATFGDATDDLTTVSGDLTVADDTTLTDKLDVLGNVVMGDAATDTVTVTGDLTVSDDSTFADAVALNGATTVGNASTDTMTMTGRLILRTLGADPLHETEGSRPAGSAGEIALYSGAVYLCTNAATPTWVKVGPA